MKLLTFPAPDPLRGDRLTTDIEVALAVPADTVVLSHSGNTISLAVPDAADESLVASIVAAHDGTPTVDELTEAKLASTGLPWTRDEYNAVRAQMQVLRDLRQLGRNAFMALTAVERDRMIYDALVAQTILDLAILRD